VHTNEYLGIHFRLDYYLDYAVDYAVRKFYTSANSICNHSHFASEISKLFLLETYCLPLISYSYEALNYNNKQLNGLNVCQLVQCKWDTTFELATLVHFVI